MTTGASRPDDFEKDLQQVSAAYRDLTGDVPPDMVDQAVLNRARRAASRKAVRPWNFGWIHAVSTAALVVLGIALLMQRPEAPPPEPLRVSKPPSDELAAPRRRTPALQVPATAPDESGQKATVVRERRQAPSAAGAAPRENETPQATAMQPEALTDTVAGEVGEKSDAAAARALLERVDEPREAGRFGSDPEAWLQQILELQRSGDAEAAAAELAAFRAAWPDYPLPAELTR